MNSNNITGDVKMQEKEMQIVRGAAELYAKYGIKSITMDDVAFHLGISKKTLYQFVNDKTELVAKVTKLAIEEKGKEFRKIFEQGYNAIEELLHVNYFISQLFKEHNPSKEYDLEKYYPEIHNELKDERRKNIYYALKKNIEKGQKEKLYRNDIDTELIAKLHVFRIENFIDNDLFDRQEIVSKDFCYEVLRYHVRGIASEKGIKYLENNIITNESIKGQ